MASCRLVPTWLMLRLLAAAADEMDHDVQRVEIFMYIYIRYEKDPSIVDLGLLFNLYIN